MRCPVPERGPDYGERVWKRIENRMAPLPRLWFGWAPWRWAAAGAAFAGMLALAFLAGRSYPRAQNHAPMAAADAQAGEGVLMAAVSDYLERSQLVLVELVNADPKGPLDISAEQARAANLVSETRLYRQAAAFAGDDAVGGVLDDLERVLVGIAHEPSRLSPEGLEKLRKRLKTQGFCSGSGCSIRMSGARKSRTCPVLARDYEKGKYDVPNLNAPPDWLPAGRRRVGRGPRCPTRSAATARGPRAARAAGASGAHALSKARRRSLETEQRPPGYSRQIEGGPGEDGPGPAGSQVKLKDKLGIELQDQDKAQEKLIEAQEKMAQVQQELQLKLKDKLQQDLQTEVEQDLQSKLKDKLGDLQLRYTQDFNAFSDYYGDAQSAYSLASPFKLDNGALDLLAQAGTADRL